MIVDDLHSLDAASRSVIGFVGRRVESDSVVVLIARRDGYEDEPGELGLPEHRLSRLAEDDACALLTAGAPDLVPALRARVLARHRATPGAGGATHHGGFD